MDNDLVTFHCTSFFAHSTNCHSRQTILQNKLQSIFFYFLQIVTLDNFSATNPVELGGPGGPSDPCDPCGPLVNVFQVIYVLRLVGVIGMWSG